MVEVNCETDFVAKDASFIAFADAVASNALNDAPADVDALMTTSINGDSVEEARQALISKIGENIQVRRFVRESTEARWAPMFTAARSVSWLTYPVATKNSPVTSPCTLPR